MKKEFLIRTFLPLAAVLYLSGCGPAPEQVKKEESHPAAPNVVELTAGQMKTVHIAFSEVQMKALSGAVKANGMLDVPPQNLVSISAPMGGFIKSTELLQGMRVSKGDPIVVMQHQDYIQLQQDFLEVKSQLEFLKPEYQRQQELSKENVNAVKVLQQARAQYESALARSAGLRSRLQLLGIDPDKLNDQNLQSTITIRSPIAGYVTQVNVNVGMYANPADVIFKIVDTGHLHAELSVFEKDVPKIKVGQKVRVTLANEQTERLATVYLIGREIGADRTVRIHCHFDAEDDGLLPGTYLSAFIEAGAQQVPALPEAAIVNFEGKDYVFIADDKAGKFKMIPVTKGLNESGYTEVSFSSELSAGSKVVTQGAYDLMARLKNSEEE